MAISVGKSLLGENDGVNWNLSWVRLWYIKGLCLMFLWMWMTMGILFPRKLIYSSGFLKLSYLVPIWGGSVSLEQLEFLLNKLEFNVFAKVSEDISQKGKGTISSKNGNLKCGGFRIGRGMWKKASMSFVWWKSLRRN